MTNGWNISIKVYGKKKNRDRGERAWCESKTKSSPQIQPTRMRAPRSGSDGIHTFHQIFNFLKENVFCKKKKICLSPFLSLSRGPQDWLSFSDPPLRSLLATISQADQYQLLIKINFNLLDNCVCSTAQSEANTCPPPLLLWYNVRKFQPPLSLQCTKVILFTRVCMFSSYLIIEDFCFVLF